MTASDTEINANKYKQARLQLSSNVFKMTFSLYFFTFETNNVSVFEERRGKKKKVIS